MWISDKRQNPKLFTLLWLRRAFVLCTWLIIHSTQCPRHAAHRHTHTRIYKMWRLSSLINRNIIQLYASIRSSNDQSQIDRIDDKENCIVTFEWRLMIHVEWLSGRNTLRSSIHMELKTNERNHFRFCSMFRLEFDIASLSNAICQIQRARRLSLTHAMQVKWWICRQSFYWLQCMTFTFVTDALHREQCEYSIRLSMFNIGKLVGKFDRQNVMKVSGDREHTPINLINHGNHWHDLDSKIEWPQ